MYVVKQTHLSSCWLPSFGVYILRFSAKYFSFDYIYTFYYGRRFPDLCVSKPNMYGMTEGLVEGLSWVRR